MFIKSCVIFPLLAVLLAGCGGEETRPQPTLRPTAIPPTSTPRSTALPDVPAAPALGELDRPVEVQFVLPEASRSTSAVSTANALAAELLTQYDLTVRITFADNESQALSALCNGSSQGYPSAAWLSPFSLITAETACDAVPVLAVVQGMPPRAQVGMSADIIASSTITDVSQLAGRPFCRLDSHDMQTWLYPSLVLAQADINPQADLGRILDQPDSISLLRAVFEGECAASALPPGDFENLVDDLVNELDDETVSRENVLEAVKILVSAGDTSAPADPDEWSGFEAYVIPYDVLVFPDERAVRADIRENITQALIGFFANRSAGAVQPAALLDSASSVLPVSSDDYNAFRTAVSRPGWNMTFLDELPNSAQ